MKPIPGFEEYYINECGTNIIKDGLSISSRVNAGGYLSCKLRKKSFLVHRLVALTYIDNPYSLPIVMHLDNNRLNNHYSNLKFGTVKENNQYMWSLGRGVGFSKGISTWNKGMKGKDNHSSKRVAMKSGGKIIKEYDCIAHTLNDGFHPPTVTKCCKGQLKSHKGFIWCYL